MPEVPPEFRIRPLEPLSLAAPREGNIDSPFDELLDGFGGGGGAGGRSVSPWAVVITTPDPDAPTAGILFAPLVTNVLTGATTTVTGLTGYTLTSTIKLWLKTTFTSGTPSAYEVTDTGPTGNLFVYSGSLQTEAWHLIAEVVSGSQPGLPGFDFTLSGDPYHLTQKVFTEFEAAVGCVNGKPTWRVRPR